MGRKLLVPTRAFSAENILSVEDDAGVSQQYQREVRRAIPATTNTGQLRAVPFGIPDDDIDVDIFLRSAGNTNGGARWGRKDSPDANYAGKLPAHIIEDFLLIAKATAAADKPTRPKMLELASGSLLLMWIEADDAKYAMFSPTTGLGSTHTITPNFPATSTLRAIDAVQYQDTGEVVLFLLASGLKYTEIERYTSSVDDDPLTLRATPIEYDTTDLSTKTTRDFAVELLPNGRIAMLVQSTNTNGRLDSMYSDDRGVTWSVWKRAGTFGVMSAALATAYGTVPSPAGCGLIGCVDIKRTVTGSLLAVCNATCGDQSAIGASHLGTNAEPDDATPVLRLLVSDDGDTWADMITMQSSSGDVTAFHIFPEGIAEASVVVGDDGLPRIIGCLHGDSQARTGYGSTTIFDDLCMLTMRKAAVTGRDIGPVFGDPGLTRITCSDAFESDVEATTGLYTPTRTQLTMHRMSGMFSGGAGRADLDATPTYRGAVSVGAANYRGAMWLLVAGENTGDNDYTLGLMRIGAFAEINERPDVVTSAAAVLRGNVYTVGYLPFGLPDEIGSEWVKAGAVAPTLDLTTRGLRLVTDGIAAVTNWDAGASLPGTVNYPAFARFVLVPTTGGLLTGDDIAAQIVLSAPAAADEAGIGIRFTPVSLRVVDLNGGGAGIPTTLATLATRDFSEGVEVVVGFSDYQTLLGVFVRELNGDTGDPQGNPWIDSGVTPGALTPRGAFVAEMLRFGELTNNAATDQTWREVFFTRGTSNSTPRLYLFTGANAWDAATPVFHEFTDDPVPPYDDGMRHGTRALRCRAEPQHLRSGAKLSWRGKAGSYGDTWSVVSAYGWGIERVRSAPVRDVFRTPDDSTELNIVFDSGTDEENFRPDAIALFKVKAHSFYVQMHTANAWGTPAKNILVDITDAADIRRDHYRRLSAFIVGAVKSTEIQFTGDTTQAVSDHFYKSNDRITWYMYSEALDKSIRVIDNEGDRIYLEESAVGADAADKYVCFYPDKIIVPIGTLIAAGYRYMRLRFPTQTLPGDRLPSGSMSDGYHTLGLVVCGDFWDLTNPHPEWGWSKSSVSAVARTETRTGYVDAKQLGPERFVWQWGYSGLRGVADRSNLSSAPVDRAGYERMLAMFKALKYGETVCALVPTYNEGSSGGNVGHLDVFPVRVFGPVQFQHTAYECSLTSSGVVQAIFDASGITFEEVL